MKPDSWRTSFGKVLLCFLLLAGVIATSDGAGFAEERNYSVAALGTSASPLSDTAPSAMHNKLRKDQKVAGVCQVGPAIANCSANEACCTKDGMPRCCIGGCNTAQCR
jgi:hypothetical protein